MDILAGIAAYLAGLAAFFGALTVAFFVFFAAPKEPLQPQAQPQSASAMLLRRSSPSKAATVEARGKQAAKERRGHSEQKATAAASPGRTQQTATRELQQKPAPSAAHARRLLQEDRTHRWAYQQDTGFDRRFLGYAD